MPDTVRIKTKAPVATYTESAQVVVTTLGGVQIGDSEGNPRLLIPWWRVVTVEWLVTD